jgi:hypothetical protein
VVLTLLQRLVTVFVVAGVVGASPVLAQRATTEGGLARAREAIAEAQRDGGVPGDVVVLLVSARPAFTETKASFPAAATAVVVEAFGARQVRACDACMNPRLVQGESGLLYETGEAGLQTLLALDAGARSGSTRPPPASRCASSTSPTAPSCCRGTLSRGSTRGSDRRGMSR